MLNQKLQALLQHGLMLQNSGHLEQASAIYEEILKKNVKCINALQFLADISAQKQQWKKTVELLTKAISINNDPEDYYNCGVALKELKRFNEALSCFNNAIKLQGDDAEAYNNRGIVLQELKRFDEALTSYKKAIALKSDYVEVHNNLGVLFGLLKRFDESILCFRKAINLKVDYADAYSNLGNTLHELSRFDEAITCYDKAIELKHENAEAYSNRGNALKELKRFDEAIFSYSKAIELKYDYADAYNNRGNALQDLKQFDEAIFNYDKAIEFRHDYADAYSNRGNALKELKRFDEAIFNYDKTLELQPDFNYTQGMRNYLKMLMCDWQDFEINVKSLLSRIKENNKSSPSFPILALTDSLSINRKASEIWMNDKFPYNSSLGPIPKYTKKNKITLGYFSADFHNHATAYLMAELFELHDKSKFETIAFSFGPDAKDKMRQRLSKVFDQFIDVRFKSDKEIAILSRELGIDIAIDIKGITQDARSGILSYRAAPIQVNCIGYPGTMGAPYIDYIIADPTLIPMESQQHYSEKIVYLPDSYQVNDRKREIADKVFTRAELNLPEQGFVFCCFNNNFKISPHIFDGWARILKAVEGSVLWLLEDSATAGLNLRKEAQNRGLDPQRLILAKRMDLPEHLARHRLADLFLDTRPYNAHTTSSDALWAGLPVLTCMGKSFASRVAASLLNAIELPELITTTQEQYETLAIELATHPEKLKIIKNKLGHNRLTTALFDTPRFTKNLEAAYEQMYACYQADLPLNHIYIEGAGHLKVNAETR